MRAVAGGALDRAVDVAAALEVRGYGAARRPPRVRRARGRATTAPSCSRRSRSPRSRSLARAGSVAAFGAYPELHGAWDTAPWALAAAIVLLPLLPFLDRRGIGR